MNWKEAQEKDELKGGPGERWAEEGPGERPCRMSAVKDLSQESYAVLTFIIYTVLCPEKKGVLDNEIRDHLFSKKLLIVGWGMVMHTVLPAIPLQAEVGDLLDLSNTIQVWIHARLHLNNAKI